LLINNNECIIPVSVVIFKIYSPFGNVEASIVPVLLCKSDVRYLLPVFEKILTLSIVWILDCIVKIPCDGFGNIVIPLLLLFVRLLKIGVRSLLLWKSDFEKIKTIKKKLKN